MLCALTPPCSHAPLTLPSAAARRPSPLHAPTRLLIPRCAPTAHGPASNRSMPQKSSRKAIIVSCFRNPRQIPPCVACLASPCGRGAVPLQAWHSRGQRSTSPPLQFVFLLHAALRTWLTLILRSLMGTQEGSSFWLPSLVQPASPASINLSRHARMCWSPEQLLHPLLHSLAHTRQRPEEEDEQHDIGDERPVCWPFHSTQIGTLQWRTYMAIYHPCTHPGATASMHALATIHAPRPP